MFRGKIIHIHTFVKPKKREKILCDSRGISQTLFKIMTRIAVPGIERYDKPPDEVVVDGDIVQLLQQHGDTLRERIR